MVRYLVTALIVLIAGLSGCANKHALPKLPSEIDEDGLMVARLCVLGLRSIENASITINGKPYPKAMRNGHIAIALEPGTYKLESIRAEGLLLGAAPVEASSSIHPAKRGGRTTTYYYVPSRPTPVTYTTLAINREFRVEAGRVTNLGLMVYVPIADDPTKARVLENANKSRDYRVFTLDNSAEMGAFLSTNFPNLAMQLAGRETILAPGKYVEGKAIPALRRAIAALEGNGPNRVVTPEGSIMVFGRAGTIATLGTGPTGKPRVTEVLDTGTLSDVVGGAWVGERYRFLTSDAQLLHWDGERLSKTTFPYPVQPVLMKAFGDRGLLVVDNRMNIMTNNDADGPWTRHERTATKEARLDIQAVGDEDGIYVVLGTRGMPEAIYHIDADDGKGPVDIPTPFNEALFSQGDVSYVVARESGLFLLSGRASFYFWSKATRSWSVRAKPAGKCQAMKFAAQGEEISVSCDGIDYRSADGGVSWRVPAS